MIEYAPSEFASPFVGQIPDIGGGCTPLALNSFLEQKIVQHLRQLCGLSYPFPFLGIFGDTLIADDSLLK